MDKEAVQCKGTRHGILMSIAEEEPFTKAMDCLNRKFDGSPSFFTGSPISLDLGWREMEPEDLDELLELFQSRNVNLLGVISSSHNTRKICEDRGLKVIIGRLGLADHHGRRKLEKKPTRPPSAESSGREEHATLEIKNVQAGGKLAETLMVKKTIRSGQMVEHKGNLVIMGDVNPGGEVRAGGDLVILGALRGVASAGLEKGKEDSVLMALKFQPTQIRIGNLMTNKFDGRFTRSKQPVTVRIRNNTIDFSIYS